MTAHSNSGGDLTSRQVKITSLIDNKFPTIDFKQFSADMDKKPLSHLNQAEIEKAINTEKEYHFYKQALINRILIFDIDDDELDEYIDTMASLTDELRIIHGKKNLNEFVFFLQDLLGLTKTATTIQKARLWQKLFEQWKLAILQKASSGEIKRRVFVFRKLIFGLSGINEFGYNTGPDTRLTAELFDEYFKIYRFAYSLPNKYPHQLISTFLKDAEIIGFGNHEPGQLAIFKELFANNLDTEPDTLISFLEAVAFYSLNQPLDKQLTYALQKNLLPSLISKDKQTEILLKARNLWSISQGKFGIGNFLCHCYISPVNPANLSQLLTELDSITTLDFHKFSKNQIDSQSLSMAFPGLQDLIYEQRPYTHQVLVGMVDYYYTGNPSRLKKVLPKIESYINAQEAEAILLNSNNYNYEVEDLANDKKPIRAIHILKRLVDNTTPIETHPSMTSYPQLNSLLEEVSTKRIAGIPEKYIIEKALVFVNNQIRQIIEQNSTGIQPSLLLAIKWLERHTVILLQNLSYEEQQSAYRESWFKSILMFRQLTSSTEAFSPKVFEKLIHQIEGCPDPYQAYKVVADKITKDLRKTAKLYRPDDREYIIRSFWVNGISKQLIELADLRLAQRIF